jgi:hypothetical protein
MVFHIACWAIYIPLYKSQENLKNKIIQRQRRENAKSENENWENNPKYARRQRILDKSPGPLIFSGILLLIVAVFIGDGSSQDCYGRFVDYCDY